MSVRRDDEKDFLPYLVTFGENIDCDKKNWPDKCNNPDVVGNYIDKVMCNFRFRYVDVDFEHTNTNMKNHQHNRGGHPADVLHR